MAWAGLPLLVVAIVVEVHVMSMAWVEEEKRALLDIKESLKIHNASLDHSLLPSWVSHPSSDCCAWERVTCDSSSGYVISLSLYNLTWAYEPFYCPHFISLNMSLFQSFRQLASLNLSYNCFDHSLGMEDGRSNSTLTMLETLDLSHNWHLNESIIKPLAALTSLKNLNLADCDISGPFPIHELSVLRNLEQLDLSRNDLSSPMSTAQDRRSNSTLTMLETLDLSFNYHLNESIIKSLTALTSLKNLNLADCNISGPFPIQDRRSNSTLTMLETLDLSFNHHLNESIIKSLTALTSLKNLNLVNCNISGPFPIQDGRSNSTFTILETLDLSGNYHLNESIIKSLTALTSLQNLNLADCDISGPFPIQELSALQNLELLDLSYNDLSSPLSTVQDVHSFSKLSKLRTLDLTHNQLDKNIFKYLVALPALKSLFLPYNYPGENGFLNDNGFCKMLQLQELDLSNNDLIGTLDACLGNLTSLQALDLSHNSLSGSIPASSVATLVSLEYLSLSDNNFEGLFSLNSLANHSKLKVLSLGDMHNAKTFQVETGNPPWVPSFQLEYLQLSHCLPPRNIPAFLSHQNGLKFVDLSNNNLVDPFPNWLLVNNSRLTSVILNGNSFKGLLQLPSDLNEHLDQLQLLNLSNNKFQGKLPKNIGYLLPYLEWLDVSSNMFDGDIPASIGVMSNLRALDLSNNNFSGKIPKDILLGCTSLRYLRLSNNRLQGNIFSTPMDLGSLEIFLADKNQFNGTLEDGVSFSGLTVVDISRNNLSGMLPSWIVHSTQMVLSVSGNNFEGGIPMDLCKQDRRMYLDLSHNGFSGAIPSCLFNSSSLALINLRSNNLTGSIPEILSRNSFLKYIDLSNNKISGTIPESFYRLPNLGTLLLANNKLEGQLSSQICQLQRINILDLSRNKFTGSVPSCFNNMSFGNRSLNVSFEMLDFGLSIPYYYSNFYFERDIAYDRQDEVQIVTKNLSLSYKGDVLRTMSGLDLSSNQLTGEIPHQIGDLQALRSLNLSHNHLNGTIPESLHNMQQIESLDLSSNHLNGEIPRQLQDLNFLSTFSVCYNNLSGRAPNQGQFANFDESSYKGNPYLSWSNSNRRTATPPPLKTPLNDTEGRESTIDLIAFYSSFGASYVMVILTLVIILWINPHWRRAWFYHISICLKKSFGRFFDDAFF